MLLFDTLVKLSCFIVRSPIFPYFYNSDTFVHHTVFIYFLFVLFREALLSVSTSFFEEVELGSDEVKVIQFLFLRLSNLIFHPKHLGCCKTIIGVF